ncbi:MAG TPA: FHIPEP family type III secretion protein [Firmicutes bacterium]|nr:FHIPEP family type III secretion protein [Bacillota bacterium]
MNPGIANEPLQGIETREPAFGMPAIWIEEGQKERAEIAGYTVVDPGSVIITHISEVIKSHAAELLSRQDVQSLLDNLKKTQPAAVDEVVPNLLSVGEVQRVLQNLLREGIPIRDMGTIMEALGDHARNTRDPEVLTEYVRAALGRQICRQYQNQNGDLVVATVDPAIEDAIAESIEETDGGRTIALEPTLAQKFIKAVAHEVEKLVTAGNAPVLLVRPNVRPYVRKLLERSFPNLAVISYNEIVNGHRVRTVGMVRLQNEG